MELDLNNPVWIEINLKALEHNYNYVRDAISNKTKLAAVVKANAYGHGVDKISQKLNELGTEYFCVGSPYEGIELRESGIKKPIFVLAEALEFQYHDIIEADLIQTVASWRSILALNQFAKKNNKLIKVQLIIDTGMGRIGFLPEQVFNIYKKTKKLDNIIIKGIFSHFARADSANKEFSKKQFNLFNDILKELLKKGFELPLIHMANSAATVDLKATNLDLIRPGIILYGLLPSDELINTPRLKPILSLKTKIVEIRELPAGSSISYGSTYKTRKKEKIAVLPVGYKHGYPRCLSNEGDVLIKGQRVPIRGTICMGQTIVSVDNLENVRIGEEVVLIGKQKNKEIKASEIAKICGTINYEIVCNLSENLKRIYLSGDNN